MYFYTRVPDVANKVCQAFHINITLYVCTQVLLYLENQ